MHEAAPCASGGQTGITAPPAVKSSVFPNFRKIDTLLQAGAQCAPLQRLRATLANFQDLPGGTRVPSGRAGRCRASVKTEDVFPAAGDMAHGPTPMDNGAVLTV